MGTLMADNDITAKILESLQEVAPEVDTRALDPAISIRDQFDIDSVDFLNFVLTLEKKMGTRIPEVDYPKLASVNGCLAYLKASPAR